MARPANRGGALPGDPGPPESDRPAGAVAGSARPPRATGVGGSGFGARPAGQGALTLVNSVGKRPGGGATSELRSFVQEDGAAVVTTLDNIALGGATTAASVAAAAPAGAGVAVGYTASSTTWT